MRAQFVLQEVWTGLRRNLTMTVALVVVVAISLSLLGTGLLFVKQVDDTRTYWQGKVQLSIYLCTTTSVSPQCQDNGPATAAEKTQIASDLRALPQVERVFYESQAQAYQHFKQDFARWQELRDQATGALARVETALSKQLQDRQAGDRLAAGVDDKAPASYRSQVDDYFKAIAAKKTP